MQQYCRTVAAALALILCLGSFPDAFALEAERGTVLAYLIELYRKQNKPCAGHTMPQPPPLLYSEPLQEAAMESAEGGSRDIHAILAAQKLRAVRFHVFSASEAKAEDAMARLKADHCAELLEHYTHIGAAKANGRWLVIMATLEHVKGSESEAAPAPENTTPANGQGTHTLTVPSAQNAVLSPEAKAIAARINATRANGVSCSGKRKAAAPALVINQALVKAAQKHTRDMLDQAYFSTSSPSGVTLENRVRTEGYVWGMVTALLSKGPPPASAVVDLWLSSPSQCEQIMDPLFVDMGVSVSGEYWALIFARPAVSAPGLESSSGEGR